MKNKCHIAVTVSRILWIAIWVMACLPVCSQPLPPLNAMRDGDVLDVMNVNPQDIAPNPAGGVLADLSGIDMASPNVRFVVQRSQDSVTVTGMSRHVRYLQNDAGLFLTGTEEPTCRVTYTTLPQVAKYPITGGEALSGPSQAYGIYCQRLFTRTYGSHTMSTGQAGSLILPSCDTLRQVTLVRSEHTRSIRYMPLDSILRVHGQCDSTPQLPADSIPLVLARDTMPLRTVYGRYYAAGYRYPVLETIVSGPVLRGTFMPTDTVALYFSPEAQALLPLDVENMELRRIAASPGNRPSYGSGNEAAPFSFSQDDALHTVTVSPSGDASGTGVLSNDSDWQAEVLLTDQQGIVYRRVTGDARTPVTIDYSGLRQGSYIVSVNASGRSYTYKFATRHQQR